MIVISAWGINHLSSVVCSLMPQAENQAPTSGSDLSNVETFLSNSDSLLEANQPIQTSNDVQNASASSRGPKPFFYKSR